MHTSANAAKSLSCGNQAQTFSTYLKPLMVSVNTKQLYCSKEQNHQMDKILDWKLLEVAKPAIEKGMKVEAAYDINNTNRSATPTLEIQICANFNE